jgi:SAM-dependent methyltransferase
MINSADAGRMARMYRAAQDVRPAGLTRESATALYASYVEFVSSFTANGRLLDVGCGTGWSTMLFAERGFDAYGMDLNPAAFEPPGHSRLTLLGGSGLAIPFGAESFDTVAAYAVLEHVPDPARMLAEMLRVARPGGVVCVVGPNLLGLAGYAQGLTHYVWRNRPWWTVFVRTARMHRHPFGDTVPELVVGLFVAATRIAHKALRACPEFTMRKPDLIPPFDADNDSVYLCNPLDLVRFFRTRGCDVLRDAALGRKRSTRMLATGTWVAVRAPGRITTADPA